ncbi:hypothetical protein QBC39DRAFT_336572 [Podospora conica]|nr:hypothetical protein QBC39DRAFT_336572 [Schizothecium conicum]
MAFQVPEISHDEMVSFQQVHFSEPAIDHFDEEFLRAAWVEDLEDSIAAAQESCPEWMREIGGGWGDGDEFDNLNTVEDYLYNEDAYLEEYDEEYDEGDEDDDDLGYYSDGVKRTLTDEQIAIFRHSELEKLRREKEAEDAKTSRKRSAAEALSPAADAVPLETVTAAAAAAAEDGEIPEEGNLSEEGEVEGPAPKKRKKNRRKKARTRADGVVIDLRKRTWDVVETGLATLDYEGDEDMGGIPVNPMQRRTVAYDD